MPSLQTYGRALKRRSGMGKKKRSKRNKKHPFVLVKWHDAVNATMAWQTNVEVCPITTIGFLIKKDRRQVIVAHSMSEDGQFAGRFAIPLGMLVEVRELGALKD